MEAVGEATNNSCHSSLYFYESGTDEFKFLYNLTNKMPGIYGGRFCGGGYGGAYFWFIKPEQKEEVRNTIKEKFLEAFPQYTDTIRLEFCKMGTRLSSFLL